MDRHEVQVVTKSFIPTKKKKKISFQQNELFPQNQGDG